MTDLYIGGQRIEAAVVTNINVQAKHFLFVSTVFPEPGKTFSATNLPNWLNDRENKWFRDDHVLKLEVGQSVETDFTKITRMR